MKMKRFLLAFALLALTLTAAVSKPKNKLYVYNWCYYTCYFKLIYCASFTKWIYSS